MNNLSSFLQTHIILGVPNLHGVLTLPKLTLHKTVGPTSSNKVLTPPLWSLQLILKLLCFGLQPREKHLISISWTTIWKLTLFWHFLNWESKQVFFLRNKGNRTFWPQDKHVLWKFSLNYENKSLLKMCPCQYYVKIDKSKHLCT